MASKCCRRKSSKLTACSVWKGENEADPELMEGSSSHPLSNAGAWTEDEAYQIYREKLVRLRDLYVCQLGHLKHVLQLKRREFLHQWQHHGGTLTQASQPSQGGSREDCAYRCYRKRSGEEAILEHKQKQRRISASLDYFSKRDAKDVHKGHYQYLVKLHQDLSSPNQCTSVGCDHSSIPLSVKCSRHICDDDKQLLYKKCLYSFPSGSWCGNPVCQYVAPPLCGGHTDSVSLNIPTQEQDTVTMDNVDIKTDIQR